MSRRARLDRPRRGNWRTLSQLLAAGLLVLVSSFVVTAIASKMKLEEQKPSVQMKLEEQKPSAQAPATAGVAPPAAPVQTL